MPTDVAWVGEGCEDPKRTYVNADGVIVPSVTTVLSPAFDTTQISRTWVEQEVNSLAELHYVGGMAPRWMQTIDDSGESWEQVEVPAIELLTDGAYIANAGMRKLGKRADNGTLRHALLNDWLIGIQLDVDQIEEWATGKCTDLNLSTDPVQELVPGLTMILKWLETYQPEIESNETILTGDLYGGTADLVNVVLNNGVKAGIGDLKPERISRSHIAQVAAYHKLGTNLHPGAIIINVAGDKIGTRYITQEELDAYFNNYFIPLLAFHTGKSMPMPKEKSTWLK